MTLHRSSPRRLTEALSVLRTELAPATTLAQCQDLWLEVVGDLIADNASPVFERAGVLTVRCSDSSWAQELELMSQPIVERLNQRLTHGQLTRLHPRPGNA